MLVMLVLCIPQHKCSHRNQLTLLSVTHQLFFTADTQLAKLVESPEEWVHHSHGPTTDDAAPDYIGSKGVGGVPPEPPIMPWAVVPGVGST